VHHQQPAYVFPADVGRTDRQHGRSIIPEPMTAHCISDVGERLPAFAFASLFRLSVLCSQSRPHQPESQAPQHPPIHNNATPAKLQPPFVLHYPLPSTIIASYSYTLSLNTFKVFHLSSGVLSDSNKLPILFTVSRSTGLVPHLPLGTRPGIILKKAPTRKTPCLRRRAPSRDMHRAFWRSIRDRW